MVWLVLNLWDNTIVLGPTYKSTAINYLNNITSEKEVYVVVKIEVFGSE